MSRWALAWLSSLPLMLGGVEGGHWLAYRVVYPDPYERAQALAGSGHGYLSDSPLFFAIAAAVGLCALAARSLSGRASGGGQVSLVPFVVLSPLAFVLQECVERLFVGGWPFAAMLEPTFMPGLVFQLPFALAAFLLARWLLRAADRLRVLVLGWPRPVPYVLVLRSSLRGLQVDLPRTASLATCHSERGPPAAFVSVAFAAYR